jgi:mRNA interferase MazF
LNRGEIRWYAFNAPDKRRPVLILTRNSAIAFLTNVTIAPLTTTIRDIPSEVVIDESDGVPRACAVNLDNLQTVPKRNVGSVIAKLGVERMSEVDRALSFALDLSHFGVGG